MQFHKSTGETPFILILSRHPQNPAVTSEAPPPVDLDHADIRQVKLAVLHRFASPVDKSTELRYYGSRLRQLVTPKRGQHEFVDRAPHQMNTTNRLKRTAALYDAQLSSEQQCILVWTVRETEQSDVYELAKSKSRYSISIAAKEVTAK